MRRPSIDDLPIVEWILKIGLKAGPYLPPWLKWSLVVPFFLLVAILALSEYSIRALITPSKDWEIR